MCHFFLFYRKVSLCTRCRNLEPCSHICWLWNCFCESTTIAVIVCLSHKFVRKRKRMKQSMASLSSLFLLCSTVLCGCYSTWKLIDIHPVTSAGDILLSKLVGPVMTITVWISMFYSWFWMQWELGNIWWYIIYIYTWFKIWTLMILACKYPCHITNIVASYRMSSVS